MSNSFPSMISNEPPPLDQSDEEDEDSEDFRDFASGLKLDIDPSPMSTPRKDGKESLPVHNGTFTPDFPVDSKDSSANASPLKIPPHELNNQGEESSSVNAFSGKSTLSMKTSYIGTLDSEESSASENVQLNNVGHDSSIPDKNSVPTGEDSVSQGVFSSKNEGGDDDVDGDDFDDFQDFQTSSGVELAVDSRPVKTENCLLSELASVQPETSAEDNKQSVDADLPEVVTTAEVSSEDCFDELVQPQQGSGSPMKVQPASECNKEVESLSGSEALQEDETSLNAEDNNNENLNSSPTETIPNEPPAPLQRTSDTIPPSPTDSLSFPITEDDNAFDPGSQDTAGFNASFPAFDEEDEFEDFQASSSVAWPAETKTSETLPQSSVIPHLEQQTSGDTEKDEFPDFQAHFPTPTNAAADTHSQTIKEDPSQDDDDFDDFQDFQSVPSAAPSSSQPDVPPTAAPLESESFNFSRRSSLLQSKFDALVKNLFVLDYNGNEAESSQTFKPIDKKLKEDSNGDLWNQVEDFEGSQGLVFKWGNSVAQQRLLDSLKIDTSTIVYSGKWGPIEVPRFATSLVDAPLKPVSITTANGSNNNVPEDSTGGVSMVTKDSNRSGLQEENESINTKASGRSNGRVITREAEQIINQLPDLSFMRAKNLVFPNSATSPAVSSDV